VARGRCGVTSLLGGCRQIKGGGCEKRGGLGLARGFPSKRRGEEEPVARGPCPGSLQQAHSGESSFNIEKKAGPMGPGEGGGPGD